MSRQPNATEARLAAGVRRAYVLPPAPDGVTTARVTAAVDGHDQDSLVRWFPWWQTQQALAHGRDGGIALHYFRYDLRRFGLGLREPACHVLSRHRHHLMRFAARYGLGQPRLACPRPHRPYVWHFDAFGVILDRIIEDYPLPGATIDDEPPTEVV